MPHPLRGALIGAGAISQYHLSAWGQIPQAEIIAIADSHLENAKKRAGEFGIAPGMVFSDTAEMLDSIQLDFVDILALCVTGFPERIDFLSESGRTQTPNHRPPTLLALFVLIFIMTLGKSGYETIGNIYIKTTWGVNTDAQPSP